MKTITGLLLVFVCLSGIGFGQGNFEALFFPMKIEKLKYSNQFDQDGMPRDYAFDDLDGRYDAYDAIFKDSPFKKTLLVLTDQPLDTWVRFWLTYQKKEFFERCDETILRRIVDELGNTSTEINESIPRLLRLRDLWHVIASMVSEGRRLDRREFSSEYRRLGQWIDGLSGVYERMANLFDVEGFFTSGPDVDAIKGAVGDATLTEFLEDLKNRNGFKEVAFDPEWWHLSAFSGASAIKIWKWQDSEDKKASMLVRYALLPKTLQEGSTKVYSTSLIEEVFLSGVGEQPLFAEKTGEYPWAAHYKLDRKKLVKLKYEPARIHGAYLKKLDPRARVLLGFSSDALLSFRPGVRVLQSRGTCIECHPGLGGYPNRLQFFHQHDLSSVGRPSVNFQFDPAASAFDLEYWDFFPDDSAQK
jgi:hypothetical protein